MKPTFEINLNDLANVHAFAAADPQRAVICGVHSTTVHCPTSQAELLQALSRPRTPLGRAKHPAGESAGVLTLKTAVLLLLSSQQPLNPQTDHAH